MKTTNIILLIVIIFASVSCKKVFIEEPENNPVAIFDNIWNTFNEEYAPFEERGVDWNVQYDKFRNKVTAQTSDDELFNIISEMLAVLDDGHITLTAPNKNIFFSNYIRQNQVDDKLFDLSVIKEQYLESGYSAGEDNSYIYGKVKGNNIGYIFFDHVGPNFFKLDEFLDKYNDAAGIIIDMRHNQGGDFTFSYSEMGRFTQEERYVFKSKTKNGKGRNDYTDWKEWSLKPSGTYFDKPIVVLTDRYTISAGERAVMAFKTLPNVTLIGDTTNGAHGTMIARELANGWFYSLVPQKVVMYDGKSYEGIGIAPDIYVKNSLIEINAGKDKTLETAIAEIK